MAGHSRRSKYDWWTASETSYRGQPLNADDALNTSLTVPPDFQPTTMDFSKFRDTGELSDISVTVEDTEFKLHKFPLYIKSDFFRALARSSRVDKDKEQIDLADFPGGASTFAEVANYCYNIKINITKDNVCKLRCAAEFLQMNSPGNLAALTDRYLQDALTTAKLNHRFETMIDLVLQCSDLGDIAEHAGIVEKCINATVDCWLISSKYSRRYTSSEAKLPNEVEIFNKLCEFPLKWYRQLCMTARDKSVKPAVLANLVQTYISKAVNQNRGIKPDEEALGQEEEVPKQEEEVVKQEEEVPQQEEVAKAQEDPAENAEENGQDEETEPKDEPQTEEDKSGKENKGKNSPEVQVQDAPKLDIGGIMDALLLEVPTDHVMLTEAFSQRWVAEMLQIAESLGCESRHVLLKLSSRMLHRFSKGDLSALSASVLSAVVAEGCRDNHADPSDVCRVLDNYLMDQAERDNLTVDTFQTLAEAVPKDGRTSHDMLFQVLEALLTSERASVTEEQKQDLLSAVDYSRLSESTLQRAYESGLVPPDYITKAALQLCVRLRSDLDAAKVIIQDQESRLERFGLTPGAGSSWLRATMDTGVVASGSDRRHTTVPSSSTGADYETGFEKSLLRAGGRTGATPTLASDLELRMALESLDRHDDIGMTDAAPTPSVRKSNYSKYYDDDYDSYRSEPQGYTSTYTWSSRYSKN